LVGKNRRLVFEGEMLMFSNDALMRCVWDFPETPYQKRCRQLKEYIQTKLNICNVTVSRSNIGSKLYYNVDIIGNLNPTAIENLFEGIPNGLVDYVSETKKHIYLIDEDRLHDKYLKNGDLVFEEPFNFIDEFYKWNDGKIKEQSEGILSVFCDTVADLCLIYIKSSASPIDVLSDLKIENNAKYWSHSHNVMVINMEYIDLEE
jgi:hypothetical protein